MSISSMTGFARLEDNTDIGVWAWEIRSVNGRGLDVRFRLPGFLSPLEDEFRKIVRSKFKRGNISVNLAIEKNADDQASFQVNLDLAREIIQQFNPLIAEGLVEKPSVNALLGVRGVLENKPVQIALDDLQEPLIKSFNLALEQLAKARLFEGVGIEDNLIRVLLRIEELLKICGNNPALQPSAILQRITEQVQVLSKTIPQERLAQEAAILAIKADNNEELERLSNHVAAARELLNFDDAVGRKFEFLAQEFNREVNTLCAKSTNQQLTDAGLELKTLVDQIREQAANVE